MSTASPSQDEFDPDIADSRFPARRLPSLQGILQVLWLRKWLILAGWLLLAIPAGVLLSIFDLPKTYTATTILRFPEVVGAQTNVMRDIAITQGESILSVFNSFQVLEATIRKRSLRLRINTDHLFNKDVFREVRYDDELGTGHYTLRFEKGGTQASILYLPTDGKEEYLFFRGPVMDGERILAKGLDLRFVQGAPRKLEGLEIVLQFRTLEATAISLKKAMTAKAVGRTNFSVSLADRDPWMVADILNTLREQFLEVYYGTTEVQDVGILVQMEKDLELAKQKLEKSQDELSQFYQQHPELSRQESQSAGDQLVYLESRQRLESLTERLRRVREVASAKSAADSPEKMYHWANELLLAMAEAGEAKSNILRASLSEIHQRQAQLRTTLGPEHPKIAEAEGEKAGVYRQIETAQADLARRLEQEIADWRAKMVSTTPRDSRPAVKVQLEMQRLNEVNENNQQIYNRLQESYNRAKLVTGSEFFKVTVVDPARPAIYTPPSLKTRLLIAAAAVVFLLALVLGLFLGWSLLFHTIWARQDIANLLGIKLLGVVPLRRTLAPKPLPGAGEEAASAPPRKAGSGLDPLLIFHGTNFQLEDVEAFRIIREDVENTLRSASGNGKLCLLVTSSAPGEGKSTCASNLALTFARKGKRTILIDADFRLGRLAQIFGLKVETGLDDILGQQFLSESQFLETATLAYQTTLQRDLVVIPRRAPAPEAGEMVSSDRFKAFVRMVCGQFDVVIIDTPPVMITPEPLSLAEITDGVIFVCRSGVTPASEAREAVKSLQERKVKVAAILNGVRESPFSGTRFRKYSYYYQVQPKPEEKSAAR